MKKLILLSIILIVGLLFGGDGHSGPDTNKCLQSGSFDGGLGQKRRFFGPTPVAETGSLNRSFWPGFMDLWGVRTRAV